MHELVRRQALGDLIGTTGEGQDFLVGESLTVADVVCGGALTSAMRLGVTLRLPLGVLSVGLSEETCQFRAKLR